MSELTPLTFRRRTSPGPAPAANDTGINSFSITCYEHAVPESVGPELIRLYQNIFSSLDHFRAYGGLARDTCTYVARDGEQICAIFLFRRIGGIVLVLNEGMMLKAGIVEDFAGYVFSTWPTANLIVFQAVRARLDRIGYPFQRQACTAQVTMMLPASAEDYLASVGKNMRRNIRRYLKRLTSDYPSFRFDVYAGQEAEVRHMHAIIGFSRERIAGMNRAFGIEDEIPKIIALAKTAGLVGVASIDGRVCGGVIGFRAGDTYFAKVLGHDAAYKDYSLGILCCYLMICKCIASGCREFNFMWNEYHYKAALGGVRDQLDRLVIYRSPLQMMLNADFASKVLFSGWHYRLSTLMEREGMGDDLSFAERMALRGIRLLRRLRPQVKMKNARQTAQKPEPGG